MMTNALTTITLFWCGEGRVRAAMLDGEPIFCGSDAGLRGFRLKPSTSTARR